MRACVRVLFENRHDYLRDALSNGISLSFGSPEIEHFKSQVNTVSFRFKYHNKRNRTKGHTHAQTHARRTCVHVCCRPLVCPLCPTECARARPRTSAKRIGTRKSVYIYCDVVRVCVSLRVCTSRMTRILSGFMCYPACNVLSHCLCVRVFVLTIFGDTTEWAPARGASM